MPGRFLELITGVRESLNRDSGLPEAQESIYLDRADFEHYVDAPQEFDVQGFRENGVANFFYVGFLNGESGVHPKGSVDSNSESLYRDVFSSKVSIPVPDSGATRDVLLKTEGVSMKGEKVQGAEDMDEYKITIRVDQEAQKALKIFIFKNRGFHESELRSIMGIDEGMSEIIEEMRRAEKEVYYYPGIKPRSIKERINVKKIHEWLVLELRKGKSIEEISAVMDHITPMGY